MNLDMDLRCSAIKAAECGWCWRVQVIRAAEGGATWNRHLGGACRDRNRCLGTCLAVFAPHPLCLHVCAVELEGQAVDLEGATPCIPNFEQRQAELRARLAQLKDTQQLQL